MGFLALFRPKSRDAQPLVTQLDEQRMPVPAGHWRNNTAISPFVKFNVKSLVAGGCVIDGNITSEHGAAIDGKVNGDVTATVPMSALLIREGACITGKVSAPVVILRGEVIGSIEAGFVRLYAGSRVQGTIRADRLMVDVGAIIVNDAVGVSVPPTATPPADPPPSFAHPTPAPQAPSAAPPSVAPMQRRSGLRADDFVEAMQSRMDKPVRAVS